MNLKYLYPLTVALLFVACGDDSSSDPFAEAEAGGNNSGVEKIALGCDFKIEDDVWTYGYPSVLDSESQYQMSYTINGTDVVVTDKSITTGNLAKMYCKLAEPVEVNDKFGDGSEVETTSCNASKTVMTIATVTKKDGAIDGVYMTREKYFAEIMSDCKRLNHIEDEVSSSSEGNVPESSSSEGFVVSSSSENAVVESSSSEESSSSAESSSSEESSSSAESSSSEESSSSVYEYEQVAGCSFVMTDSIWAYSYTYVGVETSVRYEWIDDTTVSYLKKQTFLDEPTTQRNVNRQEKFEEAMDNCIYYKKRS